MEVDILYMFEVMNKNFRIFFVDNKRIANKVIFFDKKDASSAYYGVLVQISPGYSPIEGRLYTCYAPVRRSPPNYC